MQIAILVFLVGLVGAGILLAVHSPASPETPEPESKPEITKVRQVEVQIVASIVARHHIDLLKEDGELLGTLGSIQALRDYLCDGDRSDIMIVWPEHVALPETGETAALARRLGVDEVGTWKMADTDACK